MLHVWIPDPRRRGGVRRHGLGPPPPGAQPGAV